MTNFGSSTTSNYRKNMPDILFSHSYYYRLDPKQWKNKTPFPPLGTLYAASVMREKGYDVGLFDTNLKHGPDEIRSILEQKKPRYLVIYDDGFNYLTKMCLTNMREACFKMIGYGKKAGCKIIVSSSDAADHYQKYLDAGADFIIRGEAELTLSELIDTLDNRREVSEIKGIAFQQEGNYNVNPARTVLTNLDQLPMPAWDLAAIDDYKKIWDESGLPFTLNIATTRGCPYKCNWCAKPIYGNRYNSHSPEYIAKHIDFLNQKYGVSRFWMCDDIFGLKPNWVRSFSEQLKTRSLKISFYMQSRVDLLLKEDTIDALAEAGLEEVWVGAESASQKILDAMDKGTTVEQIRTATSLLKSKNIRVAFFLQFGYPGETIDDIESTIDMVRTLEPDNIGISVSYPLPGTKFYENVKADLLAKSNWTDSDDLEMMFRGTFRSDYYRKLQRYVHKEFRKSQGMRNLRRFFSNPMKISGSVLKSIAKLGYYWPSAYADSLMLKKLQR